jgi:hypothetical protein
LHIHLHGNISSWFCPTGLGSLTSALGFAQQGLAL